VGENTDYPRGVSTQNVPDMPDPGAGSSTYYYTNQQSSRLLFYHDHSWGITRLNVYAGEAAGYLIRDTTEEDLIARNIIPSGAYEKPLIIQDKTFVDGPVIRDTDPTWNWGTGALNATTGIRAPKTGDLWYPHVYSSAQNPYDPSGVNAFGRWHYGPWFWPPTTDTIQPVDNVYYDAANPSLQPPKIPGVPHPSAPGESFFDTAVINGAIYPTLTVEPTAYRFRVLNASNDRFWNLQMYEARPIVSAIAVGSAGSGYVNPPAVTITGGGGTGATAQAVVDEVTGAITAIELLTVGSGYTSIPTVAIAPPPAGGSQATAMASIYTSPTEVGMVPAATTGGFPADWPTDGRVAGVPDPLSMGPDWIQIGTEGGFLPQPAVIPNQPITWNNNPTTFNFGNVDLHSLLLAPAERADVIVDFSQYAGKTLIVYNDAPAAFPALDPRYDYYTASPDLSAEGGYTGTQAGFGPNTRTIMQIVVSGTANGTQYNFNALKDEFVSDAAGPGVFQKSQNPIIVGQKEYNTTYNTSFPATWPLWGYSRIGDSSMQFRTVAGTNLTLNFEPKAMQDEMGEAYDEYGRMSGKLGLELSPPSSLTQNFVLQNFVDPSTEIINDSFEPMSPVLGDGTQIWKITHNGVDTHPIHFHLFDVQLLNRVGWDGAIRLPDENELGWKDTVRVSPLEDTIVALRATSSKQPFGQPDSVRPLNPAQPLSSPMGFTLTDPHTGQPRNPPLLNQMANFGWEYVWHCHILSHEEMDMMRPIIFNAQRALAAAPVLTATGAAGSPIVLDWTDGTPFNYTTGLPTTSVGNPANEIGFRIERATIVGGTPGPYAMVGKALANKTTFTDDTTSGGTSYAYKVVAYNAAGDSPSNVVNIGGGGPTITRYEQTNSLLVWGARWQTVTSGSYSGGSARFSVRSGSSVTAYFTGTMVSLIARRGSGFGIARVSVDGGTPVDVDLYSPTNQYQQSVWTSPPLTDEPHRLVVQYSGRRNPAASSATINVDALDIAGVLTGPPSASVPTITSVVPNSGPAAGGAGSVVITGTNFTGATAVTFGTNAATAFTVNSATQITVTNIPGGTGTVDVRVTTPAGTSVIVAADRYTYTAAVTRYEQTDALLVYSGTWSTQNSASYSGGSLRYINRSGSVTVRFNGTSLTWIALKAPTLGRANVRVDGGAAVSVDLYSATGLYQQAVWSTGPLANGNHTVVISWTGQRNPASIGTPIDVDAFDIAGVLQ